MMATCTAFLIVSHTALTVSAIAVNTLVTVSFMASIFSDIAVLMFSQACLIESTKPVKNPLIASMAVLTASFTDSHAVCTFSTNPLKKPLIASITVPKTSFIFSQAFVTASLNPSLVFHSVISATTSPATSVTIRTIGLAFNAALKSHCAIVAPSFAVLYAVHAVVMALINDDIAIATFKVTNPAATPAISGDQSLNV